ncbi:MAG: hypothetical protein OXE04_04190 [bacterium]|nr:hypothetical protein [bacterium]
MERIWVWTVRAWWAALPFSAGPVLADALSPTATAWRTTASLGLWVVWAAVLLGSLVAHPKTLVLIRLALPGALVASVWAGLGAADGLSVTLVAALTAAIAVLSLSAPVGHFFVNGISYGDEVRLLLRPPVVLLVVGIPVAGVVSTGGWVSGPLLLAAEHWILGGIITPVGWCLAAIGIRSLYSLTQRWLVFVPAGVLLHDHLAVQDPLLLRRRAISSFTAAERGANAVDLTGGATGLILQITGSGSISFLPPKTRTQTTADALLVAPCRCGLAVSLAEKRL